MRPLATVLALATVTLACAGPDHYAAYRRYAHEMGIKVEARSRIDFDGKAICHEFANGDPDTMLGELTGDAPRFEAMLRGYCPDVVSAIKFLGGRDDCQVYKGETTCRYEPPFPPRS